MIRARLAAGLGLACGCSSTGSMRSWFGHRGNGGCATGCCGGPEVVGTEGFEGGTMIGPPDGGVVPGGPILSPPEVPGVPGDGVPPITPGPPVLQGAPVTPAPPSILPGQRLVPAPQATSMPYSPR
jgi:hypothetical protein